MEKNRRLKPLMIVGTGSDVGKSVVNAAFCRIFLQDGYTPAPFKAQNMSLNSYATIDELEIGRAQAVQAEASGVACMVEMNPILLKPVKDNTSQVVLNGKPTGNKTSKELFDPVYRKELFAVATEAFDRLDAQYSPIVLEGAGSISEINLWEGDIVNMRMALYANAATLLVADIDRGGVFASVYGSIMLLPEEERKLIKGILINKFRGDVDLFESGRKQIEELTGIPVVGVLPYFKDIFIEQEDSLALKPYKEMEKRVNVAVVLLPHLSNFTDFDMLERVEEVNLYYARSARELAQADIIIIPGSKHTISDMHYLRENGLEEAILFHYHAGKPLYGVCGGYQMMGEWIYDNESVEGEVKEVRGLGIFPVATSLTNSKTTRQCRFSFMHEIVRGEGYEIHVGQTPSASPLLRMDNGETDGYFLNNSVWGSYVHGIFNNEEVVKVLLQAAGNFSLPTINYRQYKEEQYDALAQLVRSHVDMDYIYKVMKR